jgi:hypothetical protein
MFAMLTRSFATVLWALMSPLVAHVNVGPLNCGQLLISSLPSQQPIMQADALPDRGRPRLPGFTVEVTLSEKARQKLIESKETIAATSYFTATPKKGIPVSQYKRFLSRPGPLGLGYVDVEAKPGESLTFGEIKLDQSAMPVIDEQGPQLLINVTSGRRAYQDSILACDIYQGPLMPVQGKIISITCKLIRE